MARTCLRELLRGALVSTLIVGTGGLLASCVEDSMVHRLVRVETGDGADDDVDASSASDDVGEASNPDPVDATTPHDAPNVDPPEESEASPREASTTPESGPDTTPEASTGPWVRVGIPDAETGIEFVAIEDGDDIPIQMGGQGGTHARIALSVSGLGNRVFYQVFLKNLDGEGEVATLPLTRARPIACDVNDVCRISPLFVLLGGLAPSDEWEGLNVQVTAVINNADGAEATGRTTGVLEWFEQDL